MRRKIIPERGNSMCKGPEVSKAACIQRARMTEAQAVCIGEVGDKLER